jgi:inhibitor of cysteine peptidase
VVFIILLEAKKKMKKITFTLMTILLAALLIGCGAAEPPDSQPPINGTIITGEAMVESVDIMILESFPVQVNLMVRGYLPDGCTFLDEIKQERDGNRFTVTVTTQRDAEAMCTQALVEFQETIALDVRGLAAGEYAVTVNGVANSFRLDVDNSLPEGEGNPAANAIIAGLISEGIPAEEISIVEVRSVEWPDACLGVQIEGMMCAQVITPGYVVQLDVAGVFMVFHTNADGSQVLLAQATE